MTYNLPKKQLAKLVGVALRSMYSILKRDHDREDEGRIETQSRRASDDKMNKQKQNVVSPPTKKDLEELEQEYIVQCTKVSRGVNFCSS